MVDKVRVILGQRNSTELLGEEIKSSSDYLSAKGIAFEESDNYLLEKIGGVIRSKLPNLSVKPTYTSENITSIEYFNGFTQTVINRILRNDIAYTGDLISSEAWKIYDTADGSTVLSTITITYSYTNDLVTNVQVSET